MGEFLFGSAPSSSMMQTPGARQADQFFQGKANQENYGFNVDQEFYDKRFDQVISDSSERSRGTFADLGFSGGRQGVLGSSLANIEARGGLEKEKEIMGASEAHKAQILGGLGGGGGQVANTPGSQGLIGGLAQTVAGGATRKYLSPKIG